MIAKRLANPVEERARASTLMRELRETLIDFKPLDNMDEARIWAICRTDTEKMIGLFAEFVVNQGKANEHL